MFCFEVLAAKLENRDPMTLYQVMTTWTEYPKGLETSDDEPSDDESANTSTKTTKPAPSTSNSRPAVGGANSTGISTPSTNSSTSLTPSTAASSLDLEEPPFTPVGIGRKTSQRTASITESPLFVTWNKASARYGTYNLRGCIGTFEPMSLSTGLSSYSLIAALEDYRFSPISKSELPMLEVAVTLLTDFETCSEPMDWEIGVHGLRISFYYRNKRYGSTYLPDVAPEQGWNKEETLVSLMRKAGWAGKKEKWAEVSDLKVVRYQGKRETVEYEEYRRWKDWVDKGAKN
jgi:uncharacterized protein (TIGR00296 family)